MNIIEAIIELLISNIAFIILIAGGIYSFVKRMNDSKEMNNPKQRKSVNDRPKQSVSPFGVPVKAETVPVQAQNIQEKGRAIREEKYNHRIEKKDDDRLINRYKDKEGEIISSFKVDESELKKAVIWSEILSKPKALQKR